MKENLAEKTVSQNLIKQVSSERLNLPSAFWKMLALDALLIISAWWLGNSYANYIAGNGFGILLPFSAFVLFAIFSILATILIPNFRHRFFVLVLEIVAILVSFMNAPATAVEIVGGFLFVLLLWGIILARSEARNSLALRFFRIMHCELGKMLTAVSLAAIILYIPSWNQKNIFVSQNIFRGMYSSFAGVAHNFFPEYNMNGTVQDLAQSIAIAQLKANAGFGALPLSAKDVAVGQIADAIVSGLKNVSPEITADEPVANATYDAIVATLTNWKNKFGSAFLVAWGIIFFFIVRSIAAVLGLVINFLGFLVYEVLIALNIVRVSGESRTREFVELT